MASTCDERTKKRERKRNHKERRVRFMFEGKEATVEYFVFLKNKVKTQKIDKNEKYEW